jgi:hypothetical protein
MGDFFLRYLHRLRQAFDDDLTMAIVLGEIGTTIARAISAPAKGCGQGASRTNVTS